MIETWHNCITGVTHRKRHPWQPVCRRDSGGKLGARRLFWRQAFRNVFTSPDRGGFRGCLRSGPGAFWRGGRSCWRVRLDRGRGWGGVCGWRRLARAIFRAMSGWWPRAFPECRRRCHLRRSRVHPARLFPRSQPRRRSDIRAGANGPGRVFPRRRVRD